MAGASPPVGAAATRHSERGHYRAKLVIFLQLRKPLPILIAYFQPSKPDYRFLVGAAADFPGPRKRHGVCGNVSADQKQGTDGRQKPPARPGSQPAMAAEGRCPEAGDFSSEKGKIISEKKERTSEIFFPFSEVLPYMSDIGVHRLPTGAAGVRCSRPFRCQSTTYAGASRLLLPWAARLWQQCQPTWRHWSGASWHPRYDGRCCSS